MSNLSDLLPTGGGQNAVDFVASGTIGNGVAVILNSDGTVSVVGLVDAITVGTSSVFNSAGTFRPVVTYDSISGKIIIAYQDGGNSYYGTAVVGTVSGTSIIFGAPAVFNSVATYHPAVTYDVNAQKVVVAWTDDSASNKSKVKVGTISGTSISFGSAVAFNNSYVFDINLVYEANAQKVILVYQDDGNGAKGTAVVGTVSGSSISFGTKSVFLNAVTNEPRAVYDSTAQKVIVTYRDNNFYYGYAVVGTVSGTGISFGSSTAVAATHAFTPVPAYDSTNNKIVIGYRDNTNSSYGTAVVGTVSGTSISFGTPVVFNNTGSTTHIAVNHSPDSGKTVISYNDAGNSNYGTSIIGSVSGSGASATISFETPIIFQTSNVIRINSVFDSGNNRTVIVCQNTTNSNYGTINTVGTTEPNNTDFIGITAEAIADTATGPVNVFGGINEAQSGLTIGSDYYVQADGSIATTVSDVLIGQAISATTINIRDLT